MTDIVARLRAELAAERERAEANKSAWRELAAEDEDKIYALTAERDELRECLGFFASVIKSGEPWTDTCQRKYDDALNKGGTDGH